MKEDQSGHLYPLSDCKRDTDPPISDINDRDEFWNMPELEYTTFINDFVNHNKHEIEYSGSPFLPASELFQSESELYTDKTVVESELPELIVCYKEINCVKDIGIDDGVPVEDKSPADRHRDNCAGLSVSVPSIEHKPDEISEGSLNFKSLSPDVPKTLSKEDIDDHAVDECASKEQRGFKSLFSGNQKYFPEGSVNKDGRSQEDLMQSGETNGNVPDKIENDDSEVEYIATSMLALQEFGTLSIPQSFKDFADKDGYEVVQQPNQSPSVEANLENFDVVSKAEELNKNGPANKLVCSGKVESRTTLTFDFDSSKHVAADCSRGSAEATKPSSKSDIVLNHNGGTTNDPLSASQAQYANVDGGIVDIRLEAMMNPKNWNYNNPFIDNGVQSTNMEGSTGNFDQEAVVHHKEGNSNNPFAFGEIQSSTAEQSCGNVPQSPFLNHEKGNSVPFASSEVESANIHQPTMPDPENRKSNNPFAVDEIQHPDAHSESTHQLPVLYHEIGKISNPFADMEVQSSSMAEGTENVHQQPELEHNDGDSSNPFAVSKVPSARIDAITANIHENSLKLDKMPDHRDGTDELLSTSCQNQSPSSMAENNEVLQEKSFEPPNSEGTSTNLSINNRGQFGVGESSFSAAGSASAMITYSGHIAYSGSTSLRSDSSTTSTRSFAFPVLQSEWNSSPVRMRKAERRHFRKHRGWKQVIVCCKF